MNKIKMKLIFFTGALFALLLLSQEKVFAVSAPTLSEGTYLIGQTLSVWPSWSNLGNALGQALPVDPINQMALAGTCSIHTNTFCTKDANCPATEKCVLHDPQTGWNATNLTLVCSKDSYAYRYMYGGPGGFTLRARFEDAGIPADKLNAFVSSFVNTAIVKIDNTNGICSGPNEISTSQPGSCGDGKINSDEQCDPPKTTRCLNGKTDNCSNNCKWVASTASCVSTNRCGNGVLETGETCDDGIFNGKYNHCNADCRGFGALGKCGDGKLQTAYEVCDKGTPGVEKYSSTKDGSCSWDCQNWGPYCGDNIAQTQFGEECDGPPQACSTEDGSQGYKACTTGCKMGSCIPGATGPVSASGTCGDGVVGANEACDRGAANNGKQCVPAYNESCSYCSADCLNSVDVTPQQYCGNGIIESVEKCDAFGGSIYSATYVTGFTLATKDTEHNGYQALACSAETTAPRTVKKGTKSCPSCTGDIVRDCIVCGADTNGVSVSGGLVNVLQNRFGSTPLDPLFAKVGSSVGGYLSLGLGSAPNGVIAQATKDVNTADLISYTLLDPPYTAGSPNALLAKDPVCSTGEEPNYKMYVNRDWIRPLVFSVIDQAPTWQYDLVLSPVVVKNIRPSDLRIVVSWVGAGEFYGGILNPSDPNGALEGEAFKRTCSSGGIGCGYWPIEYSLGVDYYNAPVSYKKFGVRYHGFSQTAGLTNAEAFTIDTSPSGGMSDNTYAFYVRAPAQISTYKNTAKLKVEVYLPENDSNQYHFGTPAKTYYLNSAVPSDNPNAQYWRVFNINKPSAGLSMSDIPEVNSIVTNPVDPI